MWRVLFVRACRPASLLSPALSIIIIILVVLLLLLLSLRLLVAIVVALEATLGPRVQKCTGHDVLLTLKRASFQELIAALVLLERSYRGTAVQSIGHLRLFLAEGAMR